MNQLRGSTKTNRRGASAVGESEVRETACAANGTARSHSLPPESMLVDIPTDNIWQSCKQLQASSFPGNVGTSPSSGSTDVLESVYGRLSSATEFERENILQDMVKRRGFDKGKESILHHDATRDDPGTLNCIVEFMLSNGVSLDLPNCLHRTALEIAIQAGRIIAMKILLGAGASVAIRNEKEQQPLHFAIQNLASAEICRLLVQSGADVNSPLSQSEDAISPMYTTLERFLQSNNDREKDALGATMQELIDHGANIRRDGGVGETRWRSLSKHRLSWTQHLYLFVRSRCDLHCSCIIF